MASIRARSAAVLLAATACLSWGCHETGDIEVAAIEFRGNQAVDADRLEAVLATRESGRFPWSTNRYFDRAEFDRDLKRIVAFYADRGYPEARIVNVNVQLNEARDRVTLRIDISEGRPIRIETIAFEGIDAPGLVAQIRSRVPLAEGETRDQQLIAAADDLTTRTLHDQGFPYATVRVREHKGAAPDRVGLVFAADTGPTANFGPIAIEGNVSVGENVIRRQLTFRPGDLYRLSAVTESQRRLYALELFQFVNIAPRLSESRTVPVPVLVTVTEGKHRRLRLGVGYGSEEKARAMANWRHVNFYGGARTADVEGKWSSLEQGLRATFSEPYFFSQGFSFQASGSSWWTVEPAYTSNSYGGRVAVTRQFGRGPAGTTRGVRNEVRATYIREFQQYAISNEALADLSLRDELIALGLDPRSGEGAGTVSALEIDFNRDTVARPLDPRDGYSVSFHLEHAGGGLGGSFRYDEFLADGRHYLGLGPRVVWANRLRAGTLIARDAATVPFFKRYFVGGSTSVRGWGRFEVGPLSGSGLTLGGRTMLEAVSEVRFPVKGRFSAVAFLDAGNAWTEHWQLGALRYAAGPGLRYDTPIGPIRLDLGIQLNPIQGLVIDGKPERRRWRVHFNIGQAF